MMVVSVLFFVFSCALSLSPADLAAAKTENISILSYLANHFNVSVIAWVAPIIAFLAIFKSFLGHYLGAREGLNGIMIKQLRQSGKTWQLQRLNNITALFIIFTTWAVATLNPSILGMIETLCGPIIALLLFIMPTYAVYKVPTLRQHLKEKSTLFTLLIGFTALSAIIYGMVNMIF